MVDAVVETVTLKVVAEVALTATVAGTEHFAPVGAPPQVREAVPLKPAPPIESEYLAVAPRRDCRRAELPGAVLSPRWGGLQFPLVKQSEDC
jgi:hypothetical protein